MNREIKFRIYDGNNKYFLYPEIIELNKGLEYQQWTGLKDKNGKEIYEGDIVKSYYLNNITQLQQVKFGDYRTAADDPYVEAFVSSGFFVEDINNTNIKVTSSIEHEICEVIGNIYENPELLKGDK